MDQSYNICIYLLNSVKLLELSALKFYKIGPISTNMSAAVSRYFKRSFSCVQNIYQSSSTTCHVRYCCCFKGNIEKNVFLGVDVKAQCGVKRFFHDNTLNVLHYQKACRWGQNY